MTSMGSKDNFKEGKVFLQSVSDSCSVPDHKYDIIIIKTDKHGFVFWKYKLNSNTWNIYFNDEVKIKNISHKDIVSDYFLGSRFQKYYFLLKTIRDRKLNETYDNIMLVPSITTKTRRANFLHISYKDRDFDITFDYDNIKFEIEYIPFIKRKEISFRKMEKIEFLLQLLIDSHEIHENGL